MAIDWGLVSNIKLDPVGSFMEGQKLGDEQRIKNDRRVTLAEYVSDSAAKGQPLNYQGIAARLLAKGDMEGGQQFLRLSESQNERDYNRSRDLVGDRRWSQEFGLKKEVAAKPSTATTQVVNPKTGELETIVYDSETGKRINTVGRAAPKPGDFTTVTVEDTEGKPAVSLLNKTTGQLQPVGRKPAEAKPLAHTDIKDLNEKGKAVASVREFLSSFKDDYGGFGAKVIGDVANTAARNLGIGNEKAAEWWQQYDRYKNVTRNALFGAALTATEAAAFERADVNPGMSAATIRANLAAQRKAAEQAALILATPYLAGGRNAREVEGALGIPLNSLPGSSNVAPPASGLPPGAQPPQPANAPKFEPRVAAPFGPSPLNAAPAGPSAPPSQRLDQAFPPDAAGPSVRVEKLPFSPSDVAKAEPQPDGSIIVTLKDGQRKRVRLNPAKAGPR